MAHFGDYQNEIYLNGLRGVLTRVPVDFATLEARAIRALPAAVVPYVRPGVAEDRPGPVPGHARVPGASSAARSRSRIASARRPAFGCWSPSQSS